MMKMQPAAARRNGRRKVGKQKQCKAWRPSAGAAVPPQQPLQPVPAAQRLGLALQGALL